MEGIPGGYIAIELSSNGRLGAPKLFHIRNFDVANYLAIQQAEGTDRLLKVVDILQECIWERDVDIKNFHEQEVVETLLEMYKVFVGKQLISLAWTLTDEDIEWIKQNDSNPEKRINAYKKGEWRPVFDLDLNMVNFHVLPDDFKSNIKYKSKTGDFECVFTYPKYGDSLTLKKFIESYFKDKDKRFERNAEVVKRIEEAKEEYKAGNTSIDISRLPYIPKNEYDELKEYQLEKAETATMALKSMYIQSIDGKDISNLPLSKKMEIVNLDPRIDHNIFSTVEKKFEEMKVGVDENVIVYDPVLKKETKIPFRLQVPVVLESLSTGRPDDDLFEFV